MLDKLTDYLSKHPFSHQGNGTVSWCLFWGSAPKLLLSLEQRMDGFPKVPEAHQSTSSGSYRHPKSGRVPTDFQKSSERIKIPAEGQ